MIKEKEVKCLAEPWEQKLGQKQLSFSYSKWNFDENSYSDTTTSGVWLEECFAFYVETTLEYS